MTFKIYGDDGIHTTELGNSDEELTTLERATEVFNQLIVETRQYNLEANEQEENHEWFTFYIEVHEVDEDGEEEWEPILSHVFAEDDENPPQKLVAQWEELNS